MSQEIIFTKTTDLVSDIYKPKPASEFLPDWYKNTSSYLDGKKEPPIGNNVTNATIKKCLPVFDALTAGYIIPTYQDLWIRKTSTGEVLYQVMGDINIEFHGTVQAPFHPAMNNLPYPKWVNPWSIQTPKGYSSFFMPPVHMANKYFTVLPGFVDTDSYKSTIHFPFVLNDINFEGLIPAGTPMVQVIPIKRESWTHSFGSEKEIKGIKEDATKLASMFFDRYKKLFWESKSYR